MPNGKFRVLLVDQNQNRRVIGEYVDAETAKSEWRKANFEASGLMGAAPEPVQATISEPDLMALSIYVFSEAVLMHGANIEGKYAAGMTTEALQTLRTSLIVRGILNDVQS